MFSCSGVSGHCCVWCCCLRLDYLRFYKQEQDSGLLVITGNPEQTTALFKKLAINQT